jgi:hypothetical protein
MSDPPTEAAAPTSELVKTIFWALSSLIARLDAAETTLAAVRGENERNQDRAVRAADNAMRLRAENVALQRTVRCMDDHLGSQRTRCPECAKTIATLTNPGAGE